MLTYRDHSKLLFWGLGNAIEGDGDNDLYWKPLEVLAKVVKEIDPEGNPLTYHWTLTAESAGRDKHNRERPTKPLIKYLIQSEGASATFQAPTKAGDYRVHLRVTDTRKRAATGNFLIKVK